jgi:GDP-mannose 6-dehydrogenase
MYGMGYVGCISATCLANLGHHVTGFDIDGRKLKMLKIGRCPIVEPGLNEALQRAIDSKHLQVLTDQNCPAEASMICVGTPSNSNGSLQLDYVNHVVEQIGTYLRSIKTYHVIIVRSTVLPGTVSDIIIPLLEKRSGKIAGEDFGVCMNPEFMREGSSLNDFYHPIFTLIGEFDRRSGDVVEEIYKGINSPIIRTEINVAEMVKYACNTFHAIKVAFANEIGNICKKFNIDGYKVMDIFCRDTELNISPYYLKPGFAFGGSCLPKDTRAILYKANQMDIELPLLRSALISNRQQIERAYEIIKKTKGNRIGVLGLSFKAGTDDLRESPMVELVEKLIGKGYKVKIYDSEVSLAKLDGGNKKHIEQATPHISTLLKMSLQDVINRSDIVVVGKKSPEIADIVNSLPEGKVVIDLVRIIEEPYEYKGNYEGICWSVLAPMFAGFAQFI